MTKLSQFALISSLLVGSFGCSAEPSVQADVASSANTRAVSVAKKTSIPSGTHLSVFLIDAVDTRTSSAGETFMARLAESVIVDGITVIESGAKVSGRIVDIADSGRVKGKASIQLVLTDIEKNGRMVSITTNTYSATAESNTKRDAGIVAGGAGIGAVVGALSDGKKGAGIGALAGGGAGTGVVLATKGQEIHYGPETRLNFILASSVQI
jgi:hypothetical protein